MYFGWQFSNSAPQGGMEEGGERENLFCFSLFSTVEKCCSFGGLNHWG